MGGERKGRRKDGGGGGLGGRMIGGNGMANGFVGRRSEGIRVQG